MGLFKKKVKKNEEQIECLDVQDGEVSSINNQNTITEKSGEKIEYEPLKPIVLDKEA